MIPFPLDEHPTTPLTPINLFPDEEFARKLKIRARQQRQTAHREGVDAGSRFAAAEWAALMDSLTEGPVTPYEGPVLFLWEHLPLPLVGNTEQAVNFDTYLALLNQTIAPWRQHEDILCAKRRVLATGQAVPLRLELVFALNGIAAKLPPEFLQAYTIPPLYHAISLSRAYNDTVHVERFPLPDGEPVYGMARITLKGEIVGAS